MDAFSTRYWKPVFPLNKLRLDQRQLCDIQGRLFELARANGYDCPAFIEAFMNSDVARRMDSTFDFLQWAGEEYLLEELDAEAGGRPPPAPPGAASLCIGQATSIASGITLPERRAGTFYAIADADTMGGAYLGMHVLDPQLAIENLKELAKRRQSQDRWRQSI